MRVGPGRRGSGPFHREESAEAIGGDTPRVRGLGAGGPSALAVVFVWPASSFLWQTEAGRRATELGATLQGYAAQAVIGSATPSVSSPMKWVDNGISPIIQGMQSSWSNVTDKAPS